MGSKGSKGDISELTSTVLFPEQSNHLQKVFVTMADKETMLVSKTSFERFLKLPPLLNKFVNKLFKYICSLPQHTLRKHEHEHDDVHFDYQQLIKAFDSTYRGSPSEQLRTVFAIYQKENKIDKEIMHELLTECSYISEINRELFLSDKTEDDLKEDDFEDYQKFISSIMSSIDKDHYPLDARSFLNWANHNFPSCGKAYEYFLWRIFLHVKSEDTGSREVNPLLNWPPILLGDECSKIPARDALVWTLSCILDQNQNSWTVLYSASFHGRSLNRLLSHIGSYRGPSIVLIQDSKKNIFGASVTEVWNQKPSFRQDSSAFLFTLMPQLGVYRSSGSNHNNIYIYNIRKEHLNFPLGLGFGGQMDQSAFRLFLDDDLQKGTAKEADTTYSQGKITDSEFDIVNIEVWGCGGQAALDEQLRAKHSHEKSLEKARKVKKDLGLAEDWTTGPGRSMMEWMGKTQGHADPYLDEVKKRKQEQAEGNNKEHKAIVKKQTKKRSDSGDEISSISSFSD